MTEYEYYIELKRNKNKLNRVLTKYEKNKITFKELKDTSLIISSFIKDDYNFYNSNEETQHS